MKKPLKSLAVAALCALACAGATAQQAPAGGTLDKIKASGKAVLGVREASPPMAYMLGAGEKYVGYHVELCERVLKDIVPSAKLEYMAVTAQNTIPLVQNGTLDIGCGPTTNNLARQQQVAFALTTYVSEVRMATKVDSGITTLDQLAGRNVSASTGTTAVQLLRKRERATNATYNTMLGKDHLESFLMLESGRADAFVLDDNLLAGIIANAKNPTAYRIVGDALGAEPIALLFRKDDPAFKTAVDDALRKLMKSGELEKVYTKWFVAPIPPRNTSLNLPMSPALKQLIAEPNDKPLESYAK
ncbi:MULTISPECIES: amino acid ABC transporter substrate-binding protein [unclassified Variovorax]|uniref:amino acid ABC transporter substrate-binding protein n=1 Tax=unclassified Variovorax TaxID=663243 RepID=UPI0025763525|nr:MULTISPECIES: amino acid ABC transporter substrate-binding protein [unclassified Variovorax]MDM0090636.1 amino acid ABC transporter substrate-binding protein [Variovorax sp. J22G40]MDM0149362.1 amino acid ABC transporter substrate-binding protein [Variovorax sp. J2P1-31]